MRHNGATKGTRKRERNWPHFRGVSAHWRHFDCAKAMKFTIRHLWGLRQLVHPLKLVLRQVRRPGGRRLHGAVFRREQIQSSSFCGACGSGGGGVSGAHGLSGSVYVGLML